MPSPGSAGARIVRWGLGDFFWIWPAGIVGSVVLGSIGFGISGDQVGHAGALTTALSALGQFGGWLVCLIIVSRTKGRSLRADFGFLVRPKDWWAVLAGGALEIVLLIPLIPILILARGHTEDVVNELRDSSGAKRAVLVVLAALIAPAIEELLFRGLLQRSLRRRLQPAVAIGIAAAAFAFAHPLLSPTLGTLAVVPALYAFGAISGVAAERTGNLSVSILLHVGFNLPTVLTAVILVRR
jgi:membrane protease YdiL (CAAX protease family)